MSSDKLPLRDGGDLPSNEELVDSLINDFEKNLTPNDEVAEDAIPVDVFNDGNENVGEEEVFIEKADFIDEDELKVKDSQYTEEERLQLKVEAEEIKMIGNAQFKNAKFRESAETYTLALRTCPFSFSRERAVLYANRGAAKIHVGLAESAIEDCSKAVELDPNYVKAYVRRAQLLEKADKLEEALEDYKKILEFDPGHKDATVACTRLPPLINERNEKMKAEMMGKLKDLGNMILKPFGLSTNNFQMVQDPNSGGYSISFKQ